MALRWEILYIVLRVNDLLGWGFISCDVFFIDLVFFLGWRFGGLALRRILAVWVGSFVSGFVVFSWFMVLRRGVFDYLFSV